MKKVDFGLMYEKRLQGRAFRDAEIAETGRAIRRPVPMSANNTSVELSKEYLTTSVLEHSCNLEETGSTSLERPEIE